MFTMGTASAQACPQINAFATVLHLCNQDTLMELIEINSHALKSVPELSLMVNVTTKHKEIALFKNYMVLTDRSWM